MIKVEQRPTVDAHNIIYLLPSATRLWGKVSDLEDLAGTGFYNTWYF